METTSKPTYLCHDGFFYKEIFSMLLLVALQNVVNYSVNMADNIMLGSYSQSALSGAACVNQFFFVVQMLANGLATGFSAIGAQYWGQKRTEPICRLAGIGLKWEIIVSVAVFAVMALLPEQILGLFTNDETIIVEGVAYMGIIKYSMIPYFISVMLIMVMRTVGTVHIATWLSAVTLLINVSVNYTLIFGHFGFEEMGIRGAAIGTLIARCVELGVMIWYVGSRDKKLKLFKSGLLMSDGGMTKDFFAVTMPVMITSICWALATPVQSGILGHVSSDAIAANSVASTFYQYLKVISSSFGAVSAVIIGRTVGTGDIVRVKQQAHSLELITIALGVTLAGLLFVLRVPLLTLYKLNPEALVLADRLIKLMCFIMIGMSYEAQMLFGVMRGAGDTKFTSFINMFFTWTVSVPLAFLSAFVWKLDVVWIVLCIQSDQIIKCIPAYIRLHFSGDKWIKKLTREENPAEA